jgi:hypothetical protein
MDDEVRRANQEVRGAHAVGRVGESFQHLDLDVGSGRVVFATHLSMEEPSSLHILAILAFTVRSTWSPAL